MWKNKMFIVVCGWLILNLITPAANLQESEKSDHHSGYLGITLSELSRLDKRQLDADFGVLVIDVQKESPADQAGILEDDVIQYYDGERVKRVETLVELVRKTKPGRRVSIQLKRIGKDVSVKAEIGEKTGHRPGFLGDENPELEFIPKARIYAGRPFLGVHLFPMNEDLKGYFHSSGALILEVEEGSPAERGGLKSGDVITGMGSESISGIEDVHRVLEDLEPGAEIQMEIVRRGKSKTLSITLGKNKSMMYWHQDEKEWFFPGIRIIRENLDGLRDRLKERVVPLREKIRRHHVVI